MELDEFISETLKAIIKGTGDANKYALENGAVVNPMRPGAEQTKYFRIRKNGETLGYNQFHTIQFDVAVTATSKESGDLSGGIKVLSLNIGGKKSDETRNEVVSRIKFDLEVLLPTGNDSIVADTPLRK